VRGDDPNELIGGTPKQPSGPDQKSDKYSRPERSKSEGFPYLLRYAQGRRVTELALHRGPSADFAGYYRGI